MPRTVMKEFQVEHLQVLDKEGNVDEDVMPDLSQDEIIELYRFMWLTRIWDNKAMKLQRQGRFGTFGQATGQEATQIGATYATTPDDWFVPSFRDTGGYITRGLPMHLLIQYWQGDERGQHFPDDAKDLPIAVPVGTECLHGMGVAWGVQMDEKENAVLCFVGDGATSEGDFHEAMNFAGSFQVPLVMVVENNHWAISVPNEVQTGSETFAQKAVAYGMPGIHVDGNDVFAVYKATQEALERARNGKGPTLIECETYRMGDHTTADDASKYRSDEEVAKWEDRDPIDRLRTYMTNQGFWNEEKEDAMKEELKEQVDDAVEKAESVDEPSVEDMFTHTFKDMPWHLEEQLDELKAAQQWAAEHAPENGEEDE